MDSWAKVMADGDGQARVLRETAEAVAEFANQVHAGEIVNEAGEVSQPLYRSVSAK